MEQQIDTTIEQIARELDQAMSAKYEAYILLHRELEPHRGQPVGDTNLVEVNRILKDMQETFFALYPALQFISSRYEFATNVTNEYTAFFEGLKKASDEAEAKNREQQIIQ